MDGEMELETTHVKFFQWITNAKKLWYKSNSEESIKKEVFKILDVRKNNILFRESN